MALILFDTNIFIDMLNGVHQATIELGSYREPAISLITYMELRAGEISRPQDKPILDAVLAEFEIIELSRRITDAAIIIRGSSFVAKPKIKLPDCIIGATARDCGIPLVTRNLKDFLHAGVTVHVPYEYDPATGTVSNEITLRNSSAIPATAAHIAATVPPGFPLDFPQPCDMIYASHTL